MNEFPDGILNVWGGGQLMAFSGLDGETDYSHGLTARTAFEGAAIDLKLPGTCALHFSDEKPQETLLGSDFFVFSTGKGCIRGAFIDAWHLLVEGPVEVRETSAELEVMQQDGRALIASAGKMRREVLGADLDETIRQRQQWIANLAAPGDVQGDARRTLYKALSIMKGQVHSPQGIIKHRWTTPDRWPHRHMWLWDSAFHAIGWRHVDAGLARDMVSAVLDVQREDGFITITANPGGIAEGMTQPPVLALAVSLVDEVEPHAGWLAECYPKLAAYLEWDMKNRDTDGAGLVEWDIEGDVNCRSGESGMDNSPRFDAATQLDAVDFNSMLALEYEMLAKFAERLGHNSETGKWQERHARLCRLINQRLWNEQKQFYVDYDVDQGAQSSVVANAGFLPLICGAASKEQAAALARHMQDPTMFGTALPVPTVAARDTASYAKDMWRGPVWINMNWLIAYGFQRYGLDHISEQIRTKTVAEIERFYRKRGTIFEFYDDKQELEPPQLLRKGRCAPEVSPFHQAFFDYGWSATLYADFIFTGR